MKRDKRKYVIRINSWAIDDLTKFSSMLRGRAKILSGENIFRGGRTISVPFRARVTGEEKANRLLTALKLQGLDVSMKKWRKRHGKK